MTSGGGASSIWGVDNDDDDDDDNDENTPNSKIKCNCYLF
jgi:hypothetical protein